jgi:hypothetical protein
VGRFTFSAADSGQHRICVTPQNVPSGGGGWLSSGVHGTVKFTLDMAIGETSRIESTDKDKVETLVQKVKDLNSRLQDVRREQVFQRVRCGPTYRQRKGLYQGSLANIHCRSAKPNFATSPNTPTPASFAGHSSNLLSSVLLASGNYHTCELSSSSRSLPRVVDTTNVFRFRRRART